MLGKNSLVIIYAVVCTFILGSFQPTAATESEDDTNLRHAINDFKQENYASAYQQFLSYLPLGSPDAAYYLAYSNIDELGTDYDPVQSLAYFQLADEWGHPTAADYIVQIEPHLTAEEIITANELVASVNSKLLVPYSFARLKSKDQPLPERKDSRPPRYPHNMAVAGLQSWAIMTQVIDANGNIMFSTPLHSPRKDVLKNYLRIEDQWQYAEGESFSLRTIQFDFSMSLSESEDLRTTQKAFDDVYPLAMIGVPEYLMYLADLTTRKNQNDEPYEFMNSLDREDLIERAARGGLLHAQRRLAIQWHREVWAEYLISKGDLTTMTLYGVLLHSRAQDPELVERGAALIKAAADAGHENALAIVPYL